MARKPPMNLSYDLATAVRAYRERQGLSLGDVARRSGLSKTSLSNIEAGEGNPSLETLWRIGHALGVSVGELLSPSALGWIRVLRADEGPLVESTSGAVSRLLLTDSRQHRTEVFETTVPPGARVDLDPHIAGTEVLVVCVEGPMETGPAGEPVALRPGDAAWFPADVPHFYSVGEVGAKALIVKSFPPHPGGDPPRHDRGLVPPEAVP
jgi:transcriptional regulator with XRE-family HTH domain